MDPSTSTLDLVDPVLPTVLIAEGAELPLVDGPVPYAVQRCAPEVWADALGLAVDQALVVRPDQHVASRGPLAEVGAALGSLFPVPKVVR